MNELEEVVTFTEGSGNVFADLGLEDADELQAKAQISFLIRAILRQRKLTQVQAAQILGIDQPKVSALTKGKIVSYSLDRLLGYLMALGQDVEISVMPAEADRPRGRVHVVATKRDGNQERVWPPTTGPDLSPATLAGSPGSAGS